MSTRQYGLSGSAEQGARSFQYSASNSGVSGSQKTFASGSQDKFPSLHYTGADAIISVPLHLIPHVDGALPRSFKAYVIPAEPLSITPVPEEAVDRVKRWLKDLEPDKEIASIASDMSASQMCNDIRYLTGEDLGSPVLPMHSFSEGARIAAGWGVGLRTPELVVSLGNFGWLRSERRLVCSSSGYVSRAEANNICGKYQSLDEDAGTVMMSAHYDSRGSFGRVRHLGETTTVCTHSQLSHVN